MFLGCLPKRLGRKGKRLVWEPKTLGSEPKNFSNEPKNWVIKPKHWGKKQLLAKNFPSFLKRVLPLLLDYCSSIPAMQ